MKAERTGGDPYQNSIASWFAKAYQQDKTLGEYACGYVSPTLVMGTDGARLTLARKSIRDCVNFVFFCKDPRAAQNMTLLLALQADIRSRLFHARNGLWVIVVNLSGEQTIARGIAESVFGKWSAKRNNYLRLYPERKKPPTP